MMYASERDVGIFWNDIDEKIEYREYMDREKKSSESVEIDL